VAGELARISSDADVDRLVAMYARAKSRVEFLIRQADSRGAAGTAAFRRQQAAALETALRQLESTSPELVQRAVRGSYLDGATIVDQILTPAQPFATAAQGRFFGAHESAAAAMAGQLDGRLVAAQLTIGRQARDVFARVAREQVETGILGGLARKEVSAQIRDELLKEGTTAFVDRAGRRWALDTYAEVAARTATREAVSIGTANRMLELGADIVEISKHANSCPVCIPYEGRRFSLTGETPGYPRAIILPPFHPRCRHVATPAPIFDSIGRRRPGAIEPRSTGFFFAGDAA
jgi:Phage minor capsid protein 2